MATSSEPIRLDLRALHEECSLSKAVTDAIGLAASVVLDRRHGPGIEDAVVISGAEVTRAAVLRRCDVDDQARNSYADPQEATEDGGEALAVLVARRVLHRDVFRRLPKRTGADYMMRPLSTHGPDAFERLEASAIADGDESAARRLLSKLAQLEKYPAGQPGAAVVTNFRSSPIEIRFEEWTP